MSTSRKPRLVKMPVPIMLAITMEDAVTNPMVRCGIRDFAERVSVTVVISASTIPRLAGIANSFEVLFKFMIGEKVLGDSERSEESPVYLVGKCSRAKLRNVSLRST